MSPHEIRPIAVALVTRGGEFLVGEGYDPTADERFYRPIGGGIEFGEGSEAALRREFREELGVELANVEYVDLIENRFTFDGEPGHELVVVYAADLAETWPYERDAFAGYEESIDGEFRVAWKPLDAFESGEETVYPAEFLGLVRRL